MLKELIRDCLINATENGCNFLGWDDREIAEDILFCTDIEATVEDIEQCITELRTERGRV